MKYPIYQLILLIFVLIGGCKDDISVTETNSIDKNSTKIQQFVATVNSSHIIMSFDILDNTFPIQDVVYTLSPGDTVWNKLTVFDQDSFISYAVESESQKGTIGLLQPVDKMTVQFGFIADTSKYEAETMIKQVVILKDLLGYETRFGIYVYIKSTN